MGNDGSNFDLCTTSPQQSHERTLAQKKVTEREERQEEHACCPKPTNHPPVHGGWKVFFCVTTNTCFSLFVSGRSLFFVHARHFRRVGVCVGAASWQSGTRRRHLRYGIMSQQTFVAVLAVHLHRARVAIVRGGPVRQCVGLRHHHRTRDVCVVLLLACVTARSLRGCPVSLGSRACPRSCARAGTCTPNSCRARCRARSGR